MSPPSCTLNATVIYLQLKISHAVAPSAEVIPHHYLEGKGAVICTKTSLRCVTEGERTSNIAEDRRRSAVLLWFPTGSTALGLRNLLRILETKNHPHQGHRREKDGMGPATLVQHSTIQARWKCRVHLHPTAWTRLLLDGVLGEQGGAL